METENKDGEQERRGELEWRSWPLCRGGEEGSCVHKEQNGADSTAQPFAEGQLSARREAKQKAETPGPRVSLSFAW